MTVPFDQPNSRIFYACQAVFVKERDFEGDETFDPTSEGNNFLTGVQAVGVSSNNTSVSPLDVGRFQRSKVFYEPQDIEITLERVINKNDNLFYSISTSQYTSGSDTYKSTHFLNPANFGSKGAEDNNGKCLRNYDITVLYTPDRFSRLGSALDGVDADKDDVISVSYRNCLITSISYNISTDRITESITLTTKQIRYNSDFSTLSSYQLPIEFNPTDPLDPTTPRRGQDGDILKPHNILLHEEPCVLPAEVEQLFVAKDAAGGMVTEAGQPINGIQSIAIDVTIDYDRLTDVGEWRGGVDGKEHEQNRWTFVNLPVGVTCSFTGTLRQSMPYDSWANDGSALKEIRNVDDIYTRASGDARVFTTPFNPYYSAWSEPNRQIRICGSGLENPATEWFIWDLGKKNYIDGIQYTGGDTSGGNVEATITYQNQYSDAVFIKVLDGIVLDIVNDGPY